MGWDPLKLTCSAAQCDEILNQIWALYTCKSQAGNNIDKNRKTVHGHNMWQRERSFTVTTWSKEKKNSQILDQQHRLDSTCGSIEYLPDICSGLALGLISGWKPPNARMARVVLETDAWLATLAQRAGCTAFNPWHKGLPASVCKHQLGWRSIQPGWRSTRRTDTHWWEFYMFVWCSSRKRKVIT